MIDTPIFCKALKFAAHAASKRDVRYYLKGVRFDVRDSALSLAATDGSRLALCTLTLDHGLSSDAAVTLGNDDVRKVLSTFGKLKGVCTLRIDAPDTPHGPCTLVLESGGISLRMPGLDGQYPDFRRVIPPLNREQGAMPNLQACYLGEACDALELLAGDIKGVKSVKFDTGPVGHSVVLRPLCVHEHRVTELLVVIQPTRA